jgi:uncharacterized membrane protein SirB2
MSIEHHLLIRNIHLLCVGLTLLSFILRGIWMLRDSPWLQRRAVKIVPHLIDTILLLSGVALAMDIQQYPITHSWLSAKLAALLLYIILGSIALKRGKTNRWRGLAWIGALAVFGYIIAVARSRDAWLGFLAGSF